MAQIPMRNRHGEIVSYAIVSPEDEERVKVHKWSKIGGKRGNYAGTKIKGKNYSLHAFIKGKAPKGQVIDHINRNRLDNRRENLRFATKRQNLQNRAKTTNGYQGTCLQKNGKWRAACGVHYLGQFETALEAAKVYDRCAYVLYGEHAATNGLVPFEECRDLKLEDLRRAKKTRDLPNHIRQKGSGYCVEIRYNTKKYQRGGFATLEEAVATLARFQSEIDAIKRTERDIPVVNNAKGEAVIVYKDKEILIENDRVVSGSCVAVFDESLWTELRAYDWSIDNRGYPISHTKDRKLLQLHHLIMTLNGHNMEEILARDNVVDHINQSPLDARYANLRELTPSGNCQNKRKLANATSRYTGVTLSSVTGYWLANISKSHEVHRLGQYTDERAAAIAYNRKARELYGNGAKLNDVVEDIQPSDFRVNTVADNKTSRYRGVAFENNRWRMQIRKAGIHHNRFFDDEEEAALAYNKKALELHSPGFRFFNVIEEED